MATASAGERTERPSAKRLREARERGQVPRSQDLVAAIGWLAATVALSWTGAAGLERLQLAVVDGLQTLGSRARTSLDVATLTTLMVQQLGLLTLVTGPVLLSAGVIAVAANLLQSGWVFAPQKMTPDWSRFSPAAGFQRLKPSQSGVDLLKASVAVAMVSVLAYNLGSQLLADSTQLAWMTPGQATLRAGQALRVLLYQAGFALLALALADIGLQWWRHYSSLKMTRQEVLDEAKASDGRPEIKARIRRLQRDMTRRRMLSNVKNATVVVTNPTHYAVALEYRREAMSAPKVVAKGRDHLAQRIKTLARDHGVPTVENVPLAQTLYKSVEVGEAIPAQLFAAVAEVLAYLVRIKRLMV